jgi:hypothetical protein|tara:strand:+ start:85 stop:561 length:477 start_codon:yes stop_codon:yes gene_type:complete
VGGYTTGQESAEREVLVTENALGWQGTTMGVGASTPEDVTDRRSSVLQISSEESITFHVHALQTHKAAVITGKWLAKPLSTAVVESFLDQMNTEEARWSVLSTLKKWELTDISRVFIDGREAFPGAALRRPAKTFARTDGVAVQLVLELSKEGQQVRV